MPTELIQYHEAGAEMKVFPYISCVDMSTKGWKAGRLVSCLVPNFRRGRQRLCKVEISEQPFHLLVETIWHPFPESSKCPCNQHLSSLVRQTIFRAHHVQCITRHWQKKPEASPKRLNRKLRASSSHSSSKTSIVSCPTLATRVHRGPGKKLKSVLAIDNPSMSEQTNKGHALATLCRATREINSFNWLTTALALRIAPLAFVLEAVSWYSPILMPRILWLCFTLFLNRQTEIISRGFNGLLLPGLSSKELMEADWYPLHLPNPMLNAAETRPSFRPQGNVFSWR